MPNDARGEGMSQLETKEHLKSGTTMPKLCSGESQVDTSQFGGEEDTSEFGAQIRYSSRNVQ